MPIPGWGPVAVPASPSTHRTTLYVQILYSNTPALKHARRGRGRQTRRPPWASTAAMAGPLYVETGVEAVQRLRPSRHSL